MLSSQEGEEPVEGVGKQGFMGIHIRKGKEPTRHREQHVERSRSTEDCNTVSFSKNMGRLWDMCWDEGIEGKAWDAFLKKCLSL